MVRVAEQSVDVAAVREMPVLGIVQRVPCQPGSQPQVAVRRPHLVGVTDP